MTYPFDQDTDGAGKNTARRLKDRINNETEGHQTVIEKDLVSGETRMLKTKGGMPEITVEKKKKVALVPIGNRTFVFKVFGGTMSAIANRGGSGLVRVGVMFATAFSSYFVAPWKKIVNSRWNDVIRFEDPDSTPPMDVKLNSEVFSGQATTLLDYQPASIPYVHKGGADYANNPAVAPTQSLLYIGRFETDFKGVQNVLKTGGIGMSVSISRSDIPRPAHSAGMRVKPDGTFIFYGGFLSTVNGSGNNYLPYVSTTTWSEIKTLAAPPYIYENNHYEQGTHVEEALKAVELDFAKSYHSSIGRTDYYGPMPTDVPIITEPDPVIAGSFAPHQYNERVQKYGQVSAREITAYGYAGSDVEMTFKSNLDIVNYVSKESFEVAQSYYATYTFDLPYPPFTEGIVTPALYGYTAFGPVVIDWNSNTFFELTCKLNPSKKLYDFKWTERGESSSWPMSGRIAVWHEDTTSPYLSSWHSTTAYCPPETGPHYYKLTTEVNTVDYMYADIDEEVFITLESSMFLCKQGDWYSYGSGFIEPMYEGTYRAKFVVSIRGVETEFPIDWVQPRKPDFYGPTEWPVWLGIYGNTGDNTDPYPTIGRAYLGYMPIPMFNPLYMNQGNCPYIAYTTKAEEAAGAAPEFYLDFPVELSQFMSEGEDPSRFIPFQFLTAYYRHIQAAHDGATGAIYYQSHAWEEWMFVKPIRLQMCNGAKGPWADKIGPEFNGDPQLDISRI